MISMRDGEDFIPAFIILHTFSTHFGRIRNAYKMLLRRSQGTEPYGTLCTPGMTLSRVSD
jgi:hypothetical protein